MWYLATAWGSEGKEFKPVAFMKIGYCTLIIYATLPRVGKPGKEES
jgi:hypothetical protein